MDEIFVQEYVNTMTKRIDDLTKNEILLLTRLSLAEKALNGLIEEKAALEANIAELSAVKEGKKKVTTKNADEF